MKKFIYTGFTSCHCNINGKDFSFHQNDEYELPSNDAFVKSLEAQKLLLPVVDNQSPVVGLKKSISKKIKK